MKALSIRQPWAWLIIHGGKDIENRSWATKFRGPVLIHAAKRMIENELYDATCFAHEAWRKLRFDTRKLPKCPRSKLERGGIVGVAEIVDCVSSSSSPWFVGEYGFGLANVRSLPFHPCKGSLGFFDVQLPPELEREVLG